MFSLDVTRECASRTTSLGINDIFFDNTFFTSDAIRNYNLWSCQKVCEVLTFLSDNIYIRFGSKLYRQIEGVRMDTNCVPLVADLFLFCFERYFMLSLSDENRSEAFKRR